MGAAGCQFKAAKYTAKYSAKFGDLDDGDHKLFE
jgi:hypothetical protein